MMSRGCGMSLWAALLALGCARNGTETDNPAAPPKGIELVRSDVAYLTSSDASDSNLKAVEKAQRTFALDLYREMAANADPGDNLLVSPYSVATILAMTYAGARGNTRDEMAAVLHLGDAAEALHPAMNAIANSLREESEQSGLELELFNALWLSNHLEPEQPFLDTLSQYYDTGVYRLDFAADPDGARERINTWVSELTRGTIEDLLPERVFDPLTKLVLSNAVFLSAKWQDSFSPELTETDRFTLADGKQTTVPTMHTHRDCAAALRTDWRAVELPFVNSHASMVFVLPNEGELAEFDASFDEARLSEIVQALGVWELSLAVPRFAYDASLDLVPRLASLGMRDAFLVDPADFSGIAADSMYIGVALHKTHIAVDEVGTVAAGATVEEVRTKGIAPALSLDRPFVFFIYDHATDTILFLGRLSNPGGEPVSAEPVTIPSDSERICTLLDPCQDRTTTVEACQASLESDEPAVLDPCADCLQLRHDLCLGDEYCTDGGVSACDPTACADECPDHEF
ncbi:MAG: serpin family protein [Polyangiaceae bacterium]|nr:serpin family protein [Polyangiaceae bacterium]